MNARPRVCLLYVGGTIGMVKTERGYAPKPGFLDSYVAQMQELRRPDMPQCVVSVLDPLCDSAEMRPPDWVRIARAIVERYDDYDGFVVLHGTDTMAYTASALSFLLPGLSKPVVLTGAQLSVQDVRSDGREHIISATIAAGTLAIPEVSIYFAARLLRGNRSQKTHNDAFVAFSSGNLAPLASFGVAIDVNQHNVRAPGAGVPPSITLASEAHVAALRVFPGIDAQMLQQVLAPPTQGLVLETYGAGTFPSSNAALMQPIREAIERGVVVVNCSQCHGGAVRQNLYSTGSGLAAAGVISGRDMTPEAALTKLYCLLSRASSSAQAAIDMQRDLAGELDPTL